MAEVPLQQFLQIEWPVINRRFLHGHTLSDHLYVAVQNIAVDCLATAKHFAEPIRIIQFIVAAQKIEPLARCSIDAFVHRIVDTVVRFLSDAQPHFRMCACESGRLYKSVVSRHAILNQDFIVTKALSVNAFKASAQSATRIKRRNDDGKR